MGVYWSGFIKDLVCSPRPFAPPVTRLSKFSGYTDYLGLSVFSLGIGNHHLEYGFPSTHSTNSTSIALYIHTLIYRLYLSETISANTLYLLQAAIAVYTFSIVFGRLYCGMHSFTDCGVGVAVGAAVSVAYWVMEETIEQWISTPGWSGKSDMGDTLNKLLTYNFHLVPLTLIPLGKQFMLFVLSKLANREY